MMTTNAEEHDTVTIMEQGTISKDVDSNLNVLLPKQYLDRCVNDKIQHAIQSFLSRPIPIFQGTWASTASRGTILNTNIFPKDLLGSFTNNTYKLDGFVSLSATIVYRVQVNSVATQAGALIAHYVPYSEYMNSHTQWYSASGVTDIVGASGCRRVEMNLANETAMEIRVPLSGPYAAFNLVTGQGSFGSITLSVYSPLSSQAASSCSFTILAWFEDVDVRFPTSATLTTNFAQVGSEMKKMQRTGVISSATGQIGRGIAQVLPVVGLGWLSSPVSMLADGAEFILKALGFSKPAVEAPNALMKIAPTRFFLNGDGADTSHKLAISATNALTCVTGWAGTDIDEMRLDYVAGRPCFTRAFNWSTTDAADTQIFAIPTGPLYTQVLSTKIANAWVRTVSMPLCAKVASMYSMWRGDLVFTFRVVKTQFHSGRLIASFRPYSYTDTTRTQAQPAYNYFTELDLSLGTDFTFRVPYVATRPFLFTNYDMDNAFASSDVRNSATGTMTISVMNPLIAASTVASTVEVLVEVHMENATFVSPVKPRHLPYGIPNVAQVGSAPRVVKGKSASEITPDAIVLTEHGMCVGEAALSLRHLLKQFYPLATVTLNSQAATASAPGQSGKAFTLYPWAPVIPQLGSITATTVNNQKPSYANVYTYGTTVISEIPDMYSNLYCNYAFFRGSIRYKIVVTKKSTAFDSELPIRVLMNTWTQDSSGSYTPSMQTATPANTNGTYSNLGSGPIQPVYDVAATTAGSTAYQVGFVETELPIIYNKDGIVEFEVPFYNSGHSVPTNYGLNNPSTMRSIVYPVPQVTVFCEAFPTCTVQIYRGVGDDFEFGALLGVPQHAVWQLMNPPT